MSEIEEGIREQLAQTNSDLELFSTLETHELFIRYLASIEEQIDERRKSYERLAPAGIDDLVANEFLRGEIAGLSLAQAFFTQHKEAAESTRDLLVETLTEVGEDDE
jgi:hypothetical protein